MKKVSKTYQLETKNFNDNFLLVGICSSKEDHQIAFQLNQILDSSFYRSKQDLDFPNTNVFFSRFIWEKETEGVIAEIFSNKFQKVLSTKEKLSYTLFDTPNRKEVYLLTEFKQLDFIIKVNDRITLNKIRSALKKLSNIALNFTIEDDTIQKQLHLIFD